MPGTDKAISYDLWSNIHYGYVGIDVGIPDTDLQAFGNDPLDPFDEIAIQIGIDLRSDHGPDTLTANHVRQVVHDHLQALLFVGGGHVINYDPRDTRIEW